MGRPCPCRETPRRGTSAHQSSLVAGESLPEGYSLGLCEVCVLLDEDSGEKPVKYCHACKVSMCRACSLDWGRRARAALRKALLTRDGR